MATVLFSVFDRRELQTLRIHEPAPRLSGLSRWMCKNADNYVYTGYFPNHKFGEIINNVRNENLERQTFENNTFDIVIHLDVLEHLFNPFAALREIYRTLKDSGVCFFTVPTQAILMESTQVAYAEETGIRFVGEPKYHGNPQRPEDKALVTWRYGYDLPLRIQQQTNFDVEVRRFQARKFAAMGYMTEVYILRK